MRVILVTGSSGFVGQNLCSVLERREDISLLRYDIQNTAEDLHVALDQADAIFHLAGVNRPKDPKEFVTGNTGLTQDICKYLMEKGRKPLLVITSSAQAALDNPYGLSKRQAEKTVADYANWGNTEKILTQRREGATDLIDASPNKTPLCVSASLRQTLFRMKYE